MLSSFRLETEVVVLAAVPAELGAGDQAEAAGVEETDQGPARAAAEDPDRGLAGKSEQSVVHGTRP